MKQYHVNEIFYSIQGEGDRAGTANVFVRFAFCNLECDDQVMPTQLLVKPEQEEAARAILSSGPRPDDDTLSELTNEFALDFMERATKHAEAINRAGARLDDRVGLAMRIASHAAGFKCDTDFAGGYKLTAAQLLEAAENVAGDCRSVIFTGGEPSLQVDAELMEAFESWYTAMETNGTQHVPDGWLDWLTVSPKTAEHTLRIDHPVSELKYVRNAGQALPNPSLAAKQFFISPACQPDGRINPETMAWCVDMVKRNPDWRLSTQAHKLWAVR